MKELLLEYAKSNLWANKRMMDALLQLDDNALDKEIVSSFSSIRETVYHTWSAESIWLQRLQHVEEPIWWQGIFTGTFSEACAAWLTASETLIQFVADRDDKALSELLIYHNRAGVEHRNAMYLILQHIFNHCTYHRGQLVTMLRQAGYTNIPGTDFIGFVWSK